MPASDPSVGRYSLRFIPDAADEGIHTISFRATDASHNTSEPVSVTVNIVPRVDLTATLNATEYGLNENVVIESVLTNIGWEKEVALEAAIENTAGDLIHEFGATATTKVFEEMKR